MRQRVARKQRKQGCKDKSFAEHNLERDIREKQAKLDALRADKAAASTTAETPLQRRQNYADRHSEDQNWKAVLGLSA